MPFPSDRSRFAAASVMVPAPPAWRLESGALRHGDTPVLADLGGGWAAEPEANGGAFLHWTGEAGGAARLERALGTLPELRRFTSSARRGPFWVKPVAGTRISEVARDTLWLLAERTDGTCVLLVPLLTPTSSFLLHGETGRLALEGQSGDPGLPAAGGPLLLVATGSDPLALFRAGAQALRARGLAARLRSETPAPDFVDLLGWCTWDAFYHDVTADKVRAGLRAFAAGGVTPPFVILDDGWQTTAAGGHGEIRLAGLEPNAGFSPDLSALIHELKARHGVRYFFVWHALFGYWGGIQRSLSARYQVRDQPRQYGEGILRHDPQANEKPWGSVVGVCPPGGAAHFFADYHAALARQGVDGVKVDNQAALEAVSAGLGGRVQLARAYRQALEASVARNFSGRMINCMSCTPEGLYLAQRSVVMRTSDDFWPARPESHGEHLFVNAHTALWFGEFVLPDWDMFQSQHRFGAYHAAARAISGGPVYVSDRPGEHDFALLRQLTLWDGTVLRCAQPARLARDSLFQDPQDATRTFKICNRSGPGGVVGVFAFPPKAGQPAGVPVGAEVAPADVPELAGDGFVGCAHTTRAMWRTGPAARHALLLEPGGWELVSFAPERHGFAAFGLGDKLNGLAAIAGCEWSGERDCTVRLRDGGLFLAWAARRPRQVRCDGQEVACEHDAASGRLTVAVPAGAARTLQFLWA